TTGAVTARVKTRRSVTTTASGATRGRDAPRGPALPAAVLMRPPAGSHGGWPAATPAFQAGGPRRDLPVDTAAPPTRPARGRAARPSGAVRRGPGAQAVRTGACRRRAVRQGA